MPIKHTKTAIPDVDKVDCTDWNANHIGTLNHGTELTNVTANQHHNESHNAASHSDITSTGAQIDDAVSKKHDESHTITSHSDIVDATGAQIEELTGGGDTVLHDHDGISENTAARHAEAHNAASHTDITSTGANIDDAVTKRHDRQHAITTAADHTSTATPAQMLKADANGLPIDATNTDAQVSGAVTASHTRSHAIDDASDHTSTITQNNLMDADASGLPDDSGLSVANVSDAVTKKHTQNTDTDLDATFEATFVKKVDNVNVLADITSPGANIEDAVTKRHAQNTDTALGSGCEAADHGAAATDEVVNVSYGTGDPPDPATMTEGALWVKYTA